MSSQASESFVMRTSPRSSLNLSISSGDAVAFMKGIA